MIEANLGITGTGNSQNSNEKRVGDFSKRTSDSQN
jgi:hypothetical protein